MSFNITEKGSPTPRKTINRIAAAEDLRIDTSPEVVGTHGLQQFPPHCWPNSSLTFDMQGMKRPLGASSQGNPMVPLQQSFESFKVSQAGPTVNTPSQIHATPHCMTILCPIADQSRSSRLIQEAMTSPL